MKLIKLNPTTNSTRHQIKLSKYLLIKNSRIVKKIVGKKYSSFGRSNTFGRITSWHRQGGAKKLYKNINFKNLSSKSIVVGIVYDPNRNAFVSLNFDLLSRDFYFTLNTANIYPGTLLQIGTFLDEIKLGYRTELRNIPTGSIIHNIGREYDSSTSYVKSAGTFGQLIQSDLKHVRIKLPSNKIIKLSTKSYATLGSVSNEKQNLIYLGKAGRNRNLGKRPIVRGIAMNPVDHPHGGRTNGGRPSVTPWGLPTKGKFYLKKRKYVKI